MRIQTNRAKIKDLLVQFSALAVEGEVFIAPRPQPKESFKFYIAFSQVSPDSKNYKLLSSLRNHSILTEEKYLSELSEIRYFWKAHYRMLDAGISPGGH